MRIIYIADDGAEFDNKKACEEYERKQQEKYNRLKNILFLDKDNNIYHIISISCSNDEIYNMTEALVIYKDEDYKQFIEYSKENGWCEFYEDITGPGLWKRESSESNFFDYKWIQLLDLVEEKKINEYFYE